MHSQHKIRISLLSSPDQPLLATPFSPHLKTPKKYNTPTFTPTPTQTTRMPSHPGRCPAGLRYIPDYQGYTCTGGNHRITLTGEFIDEHEEEGRRLRERRRALVEERGRLETIHDQCQEEQRRAERRRRIQEVEDYQRARHEQRQREKEEKERENQRATELEQQKQRREFEKQRQEALDRVRSTLNAPPATASSESRTETRVQEETPASPVDEMDANPFAYPWVQNPAATATPATNQREPELVFARRTQERREMPWEQ